MALVNANTCYVLAMNSGCSKSLTRRRSNLPSSFKSLRASSQFLSLIITLALFGAPGCGTVSTVARATTIVSLSQRLRATQLSMGRAQVRASHNVAPVVIVPGTGGNQLEAKLTSEYVASKPWCCSFRKGFFRLWLDVKTLFPPFTSCFADRLSLDYNPETDAYSNVKGVETRVPYFGTTEGMEYLDPSLK